jgi:hypothetical protein
MKEAGVYARSVRKGYIQWSLACTRYTLIRWRHSCLQDVNTHLLIPVIFHYSEQIMYILLHLKII